MTEVSEAKNTARGLLASLIDEFRNLESTFGLERHSEQQARTWIEKWLTIFGWNPADPSQVVQEFQIAGREARRTRNMGERHHTRPDYALVVNGHRMLYLDAKRFSVNLEDDTSSAFQIRTYGWSAGLRLGYVFDFEELAIYDTRIKPRPNDAARVARVLYLRYTEYLDRFDDLWDYFSREAVVEGSLVRRHPDDALPRGTTTLDQEFEELLTNWRLELARAIVRHGDTRDTRIVTAAAQRILDRILFIRFCEEIGFEETGTLNSFGMDDDFWRDFMAENENRWRRIYDGILFPHSEEDDPTGVETHLRTWWIKGKVFRNIVDSLYFPNPYKFDVIPLETLGGVYERYLGKRLKISGSKVDDEFKPEYQRSKGAVYTPAWVVQRVVAKALAPIIADAEPEKILSVRVLDPACGSGGFLLGVFGYLESLILDWCRRNDQTRGPYARYDSRGWRLTRESARRIIDHCLFGVDIDPEAVEIARMSLALRFVERTALDEADEPKDLLRGIGKNIKHGNALVGTDILGLGIDTESLTDLVPFDWDGERHGFAEIVRRERGFDAVVGNPPYIEVKRYKEWLPDMYRYLKNNGRYETAAQGKTDIAMPFMELGVRLLKPGGRLGFIVQNRFFKTDYGELTRRWLLREGLLSSIEDFRDLQVFRGRTTYTTILALQKDSPTFRYQAFENMHDAETAQPCVDHEMRVEDVDAQVWSFDQPDLMALHRALTERFGALGVHEGIDIIVGLQVLWGKLYQLRFIDEDEKAFFGENAFGKRVFLDRASVRPMCRNRAFYPFRPDNADVWVIFPYDIQEGQAREIRWKEYEDRFPLTAAYLKENRTQLKKTVVCNPERDRWHLYTRPQNLARQTNPKVLFPMTIEDTVASWDLAGDVYQDNVNVNALVFADEMPETLKAVTAVFNSTLFSSLARHKCGLNDSGWRKFNRQYADLVPFPYEKLRDERRARPLAEIADKVSRLQVQTLQPANEGVTAALDAALDHAWRGLDDAVLDLYELNDEERVVAARYPRRVDRVTLLRRQAALRNHAPDEEEGLDLEDD